MDPSVWQPWGWGAGALVCGFLLCLLQPWRAQFRTARRVWLGNRWLWAAPVVITAAELLWKWSQPEDAQGPLLAAAGMETGDSLTAVLTWIFRGDAAAMILAAAFLADSAGLRRGLWKGIESVFSPGWAKFLRLLLLASATATLGLPAVRFGAGGETGHWTVRILAAPWVATAATLLLCWVILTFETACRKPDKSSKVRRMEMTGLYTARLWFPALVATVLFPLLELAGPELRGLLRAYAWPAAALLAWLPWTALRSAEAGEIHTVFRVALRRWVSGFPPFSGWLITAGVQLYAFHLLALWTVSFCPAGSVWRSLVSGIFQCGWAALAVYALGAWVAIQVDSTPSAVKDARSNRSSKSA